MSSGFPGGAPDFYASGGIGGRSVAMNNNPHVPYRSQMPGILVDPSSQIVQRRPDLIGKRSLAEFQAQHQQQQQQQQQQQPGLGLLLRSVKPRMYQHASPISPLSPVDYSASISPEFPSVSAGRYGLPLLQQLRPQPIALGNNVMAPRTANLSTVTYSNFPQNRGALQESEPESEKKIMNRLQELEKQLLDDDDVDEEGDAVSVVTHSEWSEAIQNLIIPSQKPISPSSSSSSTSSIASAVPICPKQSAHEAASAISEGMLDAAMESLTRLTQVANARGNSEQRLAAYMASALKSRLSAAENPPPVAELYSKDHIMATQMLYDMSPCFKLGFMAANLAILETTSSEQSAAKFHVLDFDIGQGGQYVNLVHALGARQNGKHTSLKITTIADPSNGGTDERLKVGEDLSQLAERLCISLKFKVVTHKIHELSRESLGCESDEVLVVNLAFKLYKMPDESVTTENPRDELLRRVKSLQPRVVTVVEQEMNANTAPFLTRVNEACAYYGALLDSLDSTVSRDRSERVQVEECLGRKLANSVACEGRDRVERCEVFGKWRARMGMAGFEPRPMSQHIADSMRSRVNSHQRGNPGFTVKEETGGICFGWNGRTLTVASAWR